ncbi:MAG: 2-phosphoglycerate kinase [Palaeococcus sp.]|uniref:2-phosphoglycerate kinase n=1 Tax=Palaeococcus sp. (in: euryarchaeotes) TaxID=2820298 RepID=UPI0025D5BE00|nr:2-phosphoglycerate kinase [Palaeococcus sp. (in: euryarchaeotes)]MCD6559425.1 2-phosphoglycerate kinase [Palaeococcus sp. (in: euryarchaeotes)]
MIIVEDKNMKLPFSRGILTRSITSAGVDVGVAYSIAAEVMKELRKRKKKVVSKNEIREITYKKLLDHGYKREARRYIFWSEIRRRGPPMILLLGGTTGVGKSTIATELAFRLGIRSVIGTDTIREVMRKMVSKELLPTIHESSFLAWRDIHAPLREVSPLIYGFERQVSHVAVGVNAIIERARKEGFNTIIEGIHLVPGYIALDDMSFMYVIRVEGKEALKSRFYARGMQSLRPTEYYLRHLDEIIRIQEFIVEKAKEHKIPIIDNIEVDVTVNLIMEDLMKRLTEKLKRKGIEVEGIT